MPYIKAMHVPFQLMYGGLICSNGLQRQTKMWKGVGGEQPDLSVQDSKQNNPDLM